MPQAARSADTPATAPSTATNDDAQPKMPVFHPPVVSGGILPIQVGGGSRGAATDGVSVAVLTPNDKALTTQEQPLLYWYLSKAAQTECEITLIQPQVPKPLLDLKYTKPTAAGLHVIRLADFKKHLKPDVLYKWSVAVIVDPKNRSADITAYGVIKVITPSPALAQQLAAATESQKTAIYAGAGIWYDALSTISTEIEQKPGDASLAQQRTFLLKQAGLDGIAHSIETLAQK